LTRQMISRNLPASVLNPLAESLGVSPCPNYYQILRLQSPSSRLQNK
jgi:hypothetical protein